MSKPSRFALKITYGAARHEEVKAVTPMIYWHKYENEDGIASSLGFGWWHFFICFNALMLKKNAI